MITALNASLPHVRFSGPGAVHPLVTSMNPDQSPEFRRAGEAFAEYVENLGYTVSGLFDGHGGAGNSDFVLYEDNGIGGRRFTVSFHHESLTPKIREADFKEAIQALEKMDGLQKTGHNQFKLGKVEFVVWLDTPNRPLNNWANDGKTKRAKREAALKQAQATQTRAIRAPKEAPPAVVADLSNTTAHLAPAIGRILEIEMRKAGLTMLHAGKKDEGFGPKGVQLRLEERDGLHGRQLMIRNQNPNLTPEVRTALHHKVLNTLAAIPGIQRLGNVSFRLHDVFLSVWSPPVASTR